MRRAALIACLALLCPATVVAMPRTTVERTIEDSNGDNRLETAPGEDHGAPREELGTASPPARGRGSA